MTNARDHLLQACFKVDPDALLCLDARTGDKLTYAEFDREARQVAAYLEGRGLSAGDCLAFSLDNSIATALLYFGAMHAGLSLVPINTGFHPRDIAELINVTSPKLVLVSAAVRKRLNEAGLELEVPSNTLRPAEAPSKSLSGLIDLDLRAAASEATPLAGSREVEPGAFLTMFSSGTTGRPKGIPFTYERLVQNGDAFNALLGVEADNRFYDVLPMTYLGGFYNLLLIPILAGGSTVIDAQFGMATLYAFWERVKLHEINTFWFNSTMLSMLLALEPDEDEDLSFVRDQTKLALCGMAACPVDLKRRFEEHFGVTLYENYGLSETCFLTTNHPGLTYKPGSVGVPLEGVEVQIVDGQRQSLPANSEGQVCVRTPYKADGYVFCDSADQVNFLPDGSFLTGDVGYLDPDGELFISGRIKDVIIRGGINIYPKAIESTLYALDGVEEAAVVGIPHEVYGEEVALVVKPKPGNDLTVEDVQSHCQEAIAHFQRPKHVFFIDEFPKGVTGKTQKNALRKLVIQRFDTIG